MATYKKVQKNPLGLGKGLVIKTESFTDEGFNADNKKKLKAAIRTGAVVEMSAEEVQASKETKTEDVKTLKAQVKQAEQRAEKAEAQVVELKAALYDGWEEMDAKELAEGFTIPELKDIGVTYLELEFKGNPNEAIITEMIVKARTEKVGE
jgi:anti-sigma28 factor (negative regulator of flagellin synthesis)